MTQVPFADAEEVDAAVQAAVAAAPAWESASLSKRTRIMFAFRELLHARRDEMARIVTAEHGKVTATRKARCSASSSWSSSPAASPQLLKGEHSWQVSRGVDSYSLRQPVGVVAGITPFNFPVDGSGLDVPAGAGGGQHVRAQAFRAGPVGVDDARRAAGRGRRPRGRVQRRARRPRGRRRAADPSSRERGVVRRLDARSPSTSTRRPPPTASGRRRSAAPRTTRSCCPTPTSTSPPTRSWPARMAPAVSAAWRCRSRSPSATTGD